MREAIGGDAADNGEIFCAAQSSQRATCPPRAAVRQFSIRLAQSQYRSYQPRAAQGDVRQAMAAEDIGGARSVE